MGLRASSNPAALSLLNRYIVKLLNLGYDPRVTPERREAMPSSPTAQACSRSYEFLQKDA